MKLSEILTKTADTLETYGMVAGRFGNTTEGHCALGAMGYVVDCVGSPMPLWDIAKRVVSLLGIKPSMDQYNHRWGLSKSEEGQLAAWSNNLVDAGKADEVIAGFRKAAELAADKGE